MRAILLSFAVIFTLSACKGDESREVILAKTPDGHSFHFMPIYEDGVTDITINIAWPMHWAFNAENNFAVPYIAGETILSGGTEELKPQEVQALFNDKNSNGLLSVRPDHAIAELSFPKEHLKDVVSVASDMLSNPQFSEAWVERVKQGMKANMARAHQQTAQKMWNAVRLAILGDTPLYDFLSLNNLEKINAVTIEELRRWHRETFVKQGVTIAVTGAISREDAGKAVDQLLSRLPDQAVSPASQVQTNFTSKTILLHIPDAEKTTLGLIGRLPATTEGNDLFDLLALQFFSQPESGPLFDAVRTELRASYGFQAAFTNYDRATRFMVITGEVETEKLASAVDVIKNAYETYRTNPDFTGFVEVRQTIADGTSHNVSFVDVAARTILELALDEQDTTQAPRLGEVVRGVTEQDVKNRMSSVFPNADKLIVIVASPNKSALPHACVITDIQQVTQCP